MTTAVVGAQHAPESDSPSMSKRLAEIVATGSFGELGRLYQPDTVLDINVPAWRYQLQGPAAIVAALQEGYPRGARYTTRPLTGGEWQILEQEAHFQEDGEEHLFREVHLMRVENGGIAEHVIYCTGHWDAETIRRQALEAPMISEAAEAHPSPGGG